MYDYTQNKSDRLRLLSISGCYKNENDENDGNEDEKRTMTEDD